MEGLDRNLIDGELRAASEGGTFETTNPATEEVLGVAADGTAADMDAAIDAARRAFDRGEWAADPAFRAGCLRQLRDALQAHGDELRELTIAEVGAPRFLTTIAQLDSPVEDLGWCADLAESYAWTTDLGEASPVGVRSRRTVVREPAGVVGAITPWNFPHQINLAKVGPALAAGCTVVLKPAPDTPWAAAAVAAIAQAETDIPAGVLNVVNGDREAVDTLLHDPRVQAVSFVGSTPIAEYIYASASANGKRCQALGGAKNHAIVMPDADLDNAVNQLLGAAFGSSGERCMALPVAVAVGEDTANRLVDKLGAAMQPLKTGPWSDSSNDFGPLITKAHQEKVRGYINSAEADGATVVVDGRNTVVPGHENGFYVGAALIDHVTPDMQSYQEEIFGPVLQVVRVNSMQEGMDLIDAHEYGNGTCIFTRDGEAARYFTDHIKVGMVGVNIPLPVPVAYHSFGGWKRSLFGDLSAYGPDSVRFYTRRKTITQRWPSAGVREGVSFAFPS